MLDDHEWAVIMRAHEHWDDPERSLAVINTERASRGLRPLKAEPLEVHPTRHRYQYSWPAISCSLVSRNPIPTSSGITSDRSMARYA